MSNLAPTSFTVRYGGLAKVLRTEVGLGIPTSLDPTAASDVAYQDYIAIWDTGATNSAITKKIVADLGLKPSGITNVLGAHNSTQVNVYFVNIRLPNGLVVCSVRVTELAGLIGQEQVLIGMDIIGLGDFAVTNVNKSTVFSFRTPSKSEIDFVAKNPSILIPPPGLNREQLRKWKKIHRS